METIDKLLEIYNRWCEERDDCIDLIETLKLQIKKRRTEIASEVLSAVDANGKLVYSNDMKRSVEIDKRAFMDEHIDKFQSQIFDLERKKRDAEREMQILYWKIEARIASPRVI